MKICNHHAFNYEGCENKECGLEISDCMMDLTQKVELRDKKIKECKDAFYKIHGDRQDSYEVRNTAEKMMNILKEFS